MRRAPAPPRQVSGQFELDRGQSLAARRDPGLELLPRLKLPEPRLPHRLHMDEHVLGFAVAGPIHETIATHAIEPFDLHRLELSGRIGERLAVGAVHACVGRARLLRQGRREVDRKNFLRLQPALQLNRNAFDDCAFGNAPAAMLAKHAEVEKHVPLHILADDKAEAASRVEPFHPAGDRWQLSWRGFLDRIQFGPSLPFRQLHRPACHRPY